MGLVSEAGPVDLILTQAYGISIFIVLPSALLFSLPPCLSACASCAKIRQSLIGGVV